MSKSNWCVMQLPNGRGPVLLRIFEVPKCGWILLCHTFSRHWCENLLTGTHPTMTGQYYAQ